MRALLTSEKVILGLNGLSITLSVVLILLLSLKTKYNVSSAAGTSPMLSPTPSSNIALTNPITINYAENGAGLYTVAILLFTFSFAATDLIVEKNWEVKGIS